jgi:hypothetical protein
MKTILLTALLILSTVAAAFAQGNAGTKPVRLDIKGVRYGTTYASVIKLLGKPLKQKNTKEYSLECRGEPTMFREMAYDGMEIGLLGDIRGRRMKVYSIMITSAKWKPLGISIGATEAGVTAKLGKPRLRSDLDREVVLEYETIPDYIGLSFHFENKKLVKILLTEAIC